MQGAHTRRTDCRYSTFGPAAPSNWTARLDAQPGRQVRKLGTRSDGPFQTTLTGVQEDNVKTRWMVMAASVALAGFIGVSIAQADEIVN